MAVPLLLYGATGRMGRAVREALGAAPDVALRLCVAPKPDEAGCPPGCAWTTPESLERGGVLAGFPPDGIVLDVSLPEGTRRLLEALGGSPRGLVCATTGLDEATEARIAALGASAPVLRAPNLSLGNAVILAWLAALPENAARSFEADIVEHHHSGKRDAPSGTARQMAQTLEGRRRPAEGPAGRAEVRVHSIRSGTAPGTHRIILAGGGETLEIVHSVHDRTAFARGALEAVRFLHGRRPGVYAAGDALLHR